MKKNYKTINIPNVQNYMSLFVSTISLFNLLVNIDKKLNILLIGLHCGFDLLLTKNKEIIIHHIVTLGIISFFMYNSIPIEPFINQIDTYISVEISSIFLVLREWYHNEIIDMFFILFFVYTRIYLYSVNIIYDYSFYNNIINYIDNPLKFIWYWGSTYGLYALNIYWTTVICKKFVKPFKQYLFNNITTEFILQYTYFSSLLWSVYNYTKNNHTNNYYVVDILGQTILSVSSYKYHETLKILYIEGNTSPDIIQKTEHMWDYLNDILSIYLRILGSSYVNLCNIDNTFFILFVLFLNGISSSYSYLKYIINLKLNNDTFHMNDSSEKFMIINFLIGSNILLNTIMSTLYLPSTKEAYCLRVNLLIIFIIISLVSLVKPFYTMNHLIIHIFLFIQTILLVKTNLIVNNNSYSA